MNLETNYKHTIFLESSHSDVDKNTGNERMEFPRAYSVCATVRSLGNQNMKQ